MRKRFKRLATRAAKKAFSSVGLEVSRAGGGRTGEPAAREPKKKVPYQRASTENLYDAVDFLRRSILHETNQRLQRRIVAEVRSGRPLQVAFLVNDRSKWNADSLLEELRTAGWSAQLYLCRGNLGPVSHDERVRAYQAEREFFREIDDSLVELYDSDRNRDVPVEEVVTADVTFLQQPWEMKDFPRRLAGRTLTAYMHYGFMMMANHGMHYNIGTFHPYLWRFFTQTEEHRLLHLQHDPSAYDRLVVTGYPKFDVYLSGTSRPHAEIWPVRGESTTRLIYAPHHALGNDNLKMSTFAWNHQFMLDLAGATPNTQWVYKPHPNLKYSAIRNGVMTRDEYTKYEGRWSELPNAVVYDDGNYFDIFKSSDVLVTDCGSFLAEYLPTGNPIIWLASTESVGLNSVGLSMSKAFYRATSIAELSEVFEDVVIRAKDPLKDVRSRAAQLLFPTTGKAAAAVVDHLRQQLTRDADTPPGADGVR